VKGLPLPDLHLPHLPRELPLHLDRWILPEYRLASLMVLLSLLFHVAVVVFLPVAPLPEAKGRPATPDVTFLSPAARMTAAALPELAYQVMYDDPAAIAVPRFGHGAPAPRAGLQPGGTAGASRLEELLPPATALSGGGENAAQVASEWGAVRPQPPRDTRGTRSDPPPAHTAWGFPPALALVEPVPDLGAAEADRPLKATLLQVAVTPEGRVSSVFVQASCESLKLDALAVAAARRFHFDPARNPAGWHTVAVNWAQRTPAEVPAAEGAP
jgi:TonB family protein